MRLQGTFLREPLLAEFALKRSLARMRSQMHIEVLPDAKGLAANFAHVRLLTSMNPHVNPNVRSVDRLGAYFALHQILTSMSPQMFSNVGLIKALKVTKFALVPLTSIWIAVGLHVDLEVTVRTVGSVAGLTHVILLARVATRMKLQGSVVVEALSTHFAMSTVLLVMLPHVQLQGLLGSL